MFCSNSTSLFTRIAKKKLLCIQTWWQFSVFFDHFIAVCILVGHGLSHCSPDPSLSCGSGSGSQDLVFSTPIIQSVTGVFPCKRQWRNIVAHKNRCRHGCIQVRVTSTSLALRLTGRTKLNRIKIDMY